MTRKVYEVLVSGWKVFVVDADSESEACSLAMDECGSDFEINEAKIESVLDDENDIKASLRHGAEDLRERA